MRQKPEFLVLSFYNCCGSDKNFYKGVVIPPLYDKTIKSFFVFLMLNSGVNEGKLFSLIIAQSIGFNN